MVPTLEYVNFKLREFDELIFSNNIFPVVRIEMADKLVSKKGEQCLGIVSWCKRTCNSKTYSLLMKISTSFDLPETDWEDVIIHEMIHCYIDIKNIKDDSSHGKVFRKYMNEINKKYGRHIGVTYTQRKQAESQPRNKTSSGSKTQHINIYNVNKNGINMSGANFDNLSNLTGINNLEGIINNAIKYATDLIDLYL